MVVQSVSHVDIVGVNMKVKEFINNYVDDGSLIRLWAKTEHGYTEVEKITTPKAKHEILDGEFAGVEFVSLKSMYSDDGFPEAINMVIGVEINEEGRDTDIGEKHGSLQKQLDRIALFTAIAKNSGASYYDVQINERNTIQLRLNYVTSNIYVKFPDEGNEAFRIKKLKKLILKKKVNFF